MNLVSMGMSFFGPAIARKMAGMLGVDSPMITTAISAALPTILAAVAGRAAKGDGAGSIFDLISGSNSASPADFESQLDGGSLTDLVSGGGGFLNQLVGGNEMSSIANAVGQHAGIPADKSSSLVGMMGPAVAGLLKGQVADQGLDAAGFANMMKGQSANIAQGMPAGFAQSLAGTGILDSVQSQLGAGAAEIRDTATQAVSSAASSAGQAANAAADTATKSGGGLMKWLIPLVIIAGLAWFFLGRGGPEAPDLSGTLGENIMVGDVNVGEQFSGVTESITGALGGITDAASAEAAIPALEGATEQVDGLAGIIGQLGGEQQGLFGGLVKTAIEAITPMAEQALGAAGEGSPIGPIIQTLLEKLGGLAG